RREDSCRAGLHGKLLVALLLDHLLEHLERFSPGAMIWQVRRSRWREVHFLYRELVAAIVPPSARARVIQRWRGHAEASVILVPERSTRGRRAAACVCSARARDHRSLESTRSPVCPPGSPTVAFSHAVLAARIPCSRVPIGEPPIMSDRRRP